MKRGSFLRRAMGLAVVPAVLFRKPLTALEWNDPDVLLAFSRYNRWTPTLLKLLHDGDIKVSRRWNKEPCPDCEATDFVYQYQNQTNVNDRRWFCLCGYTQHADGDVKVWRRWDRSSVYSG